jgi:hypothetical protein
MIVDQFSRWLELVALKEQDAESVARAFFEHYVVRFGVPFVVHTDQGRNFESDMFRSFCKLLEITKTRTTAYRPSANGQVERYNQLVLNFLRSFLAGNHRTWDQFLPVLGMCVRATVNRTTGFTPNMLRLGQEVTMPADVLYGFPVSNEPWSSPYVFLQHLRDKLDRVFRSARENVKSNQFSQKRLYDRKRKVQAFDVGDLVCKRDTTIKTGVSKKLMQPYIGPFVITQALSPYLFRIRNSKGRQQVVHHDRLRTCDFRDVPIWATRLRQQLDQEPTTEVENEPSTEELGLATLFEEEGELEKTKEVEESETSTPEEPVTSTPEEPVTSTPEEQEVDDQKETLVVKTRGGRTVKRPAHLDDYCS